MSCSTRISRACTDKGCRVSIFRSDVSGERESHSRTFIGEDAAERAEKWIGEIARKARDAGCRVAIREAKLASSDPPADPPATPNGEPRADPYLPPS